MRCVHSSPSVASLLGDGPAALRSHREDLREMGKGKRNLSSEYITFYSSVLTGGISGLGNVLGFFSRAIMHLLRNMCLILYSLKVKACFEYTAKPTGYNPSISKYLVLLKLYLFCLPG